MHPRRPWLFVPGADPAGAVKDAKYAKQLGYRMKSLVAPEHATAINKVFSISEAELKNARRIVEAFEQARRQGKGRAKVDGKLVEMPIYSAARRLLASAANTRPLQRRKPR